MGLESWGEREGGEKERERERVTLYKLYITCV
jgi:hypothetical protein